MARSAKRARRRSRRRGSCEGARCARPPTLTRPHKSARARASATRGAGNDLRADHACRIEPAHSDFCRVPRSRRRPRAGHLRTQEPVRRRLARRRPHRPARRTGTKARSRSRASIPTSSPICGCAFHASAGRAPLPARDRRRGVLRSPGLGDAQRGTEDGTGPISSFTTGFGRISCPGTSTTCRTEFRSSSKELHAAPIMAWTVRSAPQREAARKWADQIVFEGGGGREAAAPLSV